MNNSTLLKAMLIATAEMHDLDCMRSRGMIVAKLEARRKRRFRLIEKIYYHLMTLLREGEV